MEAVLALPRTTGVVMSTSTAGEAVRAFVPHPLPPEPPLALAPEDHALLERTTLAVGRLDGISGLLPDPQLFIYFYVRKEAVLSSQIEGTQSSLSDLLLFEVDPVARAPVEDVREVANYVAAMDHGLRRLREGFPLSLRLLKEIHAVLLADGRGSDKTPGEFRNSQNWIGGSRPGTAGFVPSPPHLVMECMGALEKFLHDDPVRTPTLVKAALAHVQFETIHPFLDGNGRLGRLLVTLLLCAENVLQEPVLYLSLFFKEHRSQYYDALQRVRLDGDWEGWLRFFLTGVQETSLQAFRTAQAIRSLFEEHQRTIQTVGRQSANVLRVHQYMQRQPIFSITAAARAVSLSKPTVSGCVQRLMDLGMVRETTGKERGRIYIYQRYLDVLSEGTEPLAR